MAAKAYLKENYSEAYIPNYMPQYKTKNNAQDAHEAIRPTDVFLTPEMVKDSLKPEQYRLYKLIWSRFVASQMTSAVYETVNADIEAGKYIFKAAGSKIKFPGFTAIYEESQDDDKKEASAIPALEAGETLSVKEIQFDSGFYDYANFVRRFKQRYNITPTDYRKLRGC